MKGKEITNHCLSTTITIRLVYDTKWIWGYAKNKKENDKKCKLFVFQRNCCVFPKMGTPGYRSVILHSRR